MVVCRQLGYPGIVLATSRAEFGNGMGNVFLDELDCIGNENTLLDCGHGGIGIHDCFSSEAAGVVCEREYAVTNSYHIAKIFSKFW